MFSKHSRSAIVAVACALVVGGARAASAGPVAPDPCKVFTPEQINAATGLNFGAGTPIIEGKSCQWISPSPKRGITTVDFFPPDGWTKMKTQLAGLSQTPVSGVGDDAFYVTTGTYGGMAVKKGNTVFIVKVYAIAPEKQMAILKTLANDVVAKL